MPETDPAVTPVIQPVPGLSAGAMAGLVFKVGIVAALLGGSLWLLRRYAGANPRTGGRTGAVAVVDTIALAQGRVLYLLDVGDRALIVGATAQQLSLVGEVSDAGVLARLRETPERAMPPLSDSFQRLGSFVQSLSAGRITARPPARNLVTTPDAPRGSGGQAADEQAFAELLAEYTASGYAGADHRSQAGGSVPPQRSTAAPRAEAGGTDDRNARLRLLAERLRAARETA
jgi:flagellar protein FliO/FliZ